MFCQISFADPGWKNPDTVQDPGWQNPDPGSGMEKFRSGMEKFRSGIRDSRIRNTGAYCLRCLIFSYKI
jgi:hypothetical protein